MIIGIGMDMIEIDRVIRACEKERFLRKYFTGDEVKLILADRKKAAGNFAVKEAVVKMFGTGFGRIKPAEIEVLRDGLGKPYVNLSGEAIVFAGQLGIQTVHVSISNTKKYASAFVVGESVDI